VVFPLRVVVRSRRQTCCRPGHSNWPANRELTCRCRFVSRP
jgi:hypothetical protein